MKSKLSITIFLIFIILSARLIPHIPNFTPIITLSFYIPILLGINFLPVLVFGYVLTDLILGFHQTLIFVWGSIILIGFISKKFYISLNTRAFGVLISSLLFYLLSNFGVWLSGSHGVEGLNIIDTYLIAIPYFKNTLISTIVYSTLLEFFFKNYRKQKLN